MKYNKDAFDFWYYEFEEKKDQEQQAQVQAALTRLRMLLGHTQVRHIIGSNTTLDFPTLLNQKKGILVRLSANLAPDIRTFIGAILISELLHAVRNRINRDMFSIYVDEFQHFVTGDFATLITEGRKFGIATTIAHQERAGQLLENPRVLNATQAVGNKIVFQLTPKDAAELAVEFASDSPTGIRSDPEFVTSQEPLDDLLTRSHKHPKIREFVDNYIHPAIDSIERVKARYAELRAMSIPRYTWDELNVLNMKVEVNRLVYESCRNTMQSYASGAGNYTPEILQEARHLIAEYEGWVEERARAKRGYECAKEIDNYLKKIAKWESGRRSVNLLFASIMHRGAWTHDMITEPVQYFVSDLKGEQVWDDFFVICGLFTNPDNHIKVASSQHIIKEVPQHSTAEMSAQMARGLSGLHSYTCYTKTIESREPKIRKIKTLKVNVPKIDSGSARHLREVRMIVVGERDGVLRKRADVEKEAWVRRKEYEGGKPPPPPAHEVLLGEGL